jgi:hypothetical protein
MNCIGFPQCGQRSLAWFVFMFAWPGHEAEGIASINITPSGYQNLAAGGRTYRVARRVLSNVVRARKRLRD